jgi:hypothetical protein
MAPGRFEKRKVMLRAMKAGLAVLALLAGPSVSSADLIVNGGFETGDFTGWTTGANSYPEYIVTDPVNSGTYAAQIAGYQFFPNTLSQTVTTTPGQDYRLSFWRYQDDGEPPIGLTVYWDGTPVFSETDTGFQPYQQFSATVTGTGSDTVLFSSYNDPSFTYLDDVSLDPVPEPSSLALLAGAALGLAGRAYRRRRRVA